MIGYIEPKKKILNLKLNNVIMNTSLLMDNLTSPALLFFLLGIIAVQVKSDLEIPKNSSKFISLYLLFSIGFKGGQELAHSALNMEIFWSVVFGIAIAVIIPFYTFFILKKKLGIENAGAIAAAYGSVSAVTFVTALSFLELQKIDNFKFLLVIHLLTKIYKKNDPGVPHKKKTGHSTCTNSTGSRRL